MSAPTCGGDWVFRLASRLGAALLPAVRPLVSQCDQALERWADESAAELVGDRRLAAAAIAKAALASAEHGRTRLALAFSAGAVPERVEALLVQPRPSRWRFVLLPAGLALIAVAAVLEAASDLENLSTWLATSTSADPATGCSRL